MVFGLNNMNMLGMNNMSFGNCFNSNIFGSMGNMFSGSIFGMNNMFGMGGCSPFMNCNGSINFNTMTGFAVGGALLNIGMTALNHHLSTREPQHNPTKGELKSEFNSTKEDFETKLKEFGATSLAQAESMVNVQSKQTAVDGATTAKTKVDEAITDYETRISKLQTEIDKLDKNAPDYDTKKNLLEKNKKDLENLIADGSDLKKTQKKAEGDLKVAQEALEAEKVKEEKLEELKELASKMESAEDKLIDKVSENADGFKWSRNKELKVDDFLNGTIENFDKKDVNQLVFQFCGQRDGSDIKLKYAKALANLDDTAFLNIATNNQIQVRDYAIKYVEKNENK